MGRNLPENVEVDSGAVGALPGDLWGWFLTYNDGRPSDDSTLLYLIIAAAGDVGVDDWADRHLALEIDMSGAESPDLCWENPREYRERIVRWTHCYQTIRLISRLEEDLTEVDDG